MSLATLYSTLNDQGVAPTLFGVGPLSRTIVDTTIECSIEQNVPIIFIASRNQIESDKLGSGYVEGWDQYDLSHYVRKCVEQSTLRHFCYIGRDHGGPWQRDSETARQRDSEYQAKLTWPDALNNALVSYRDDIDAGFDYLHIDTSRDPSFRDMVPLDLAAERVIELIECTETYRKQGGRGPIDYEISLEETGGVTPASDFEYFTDQLLREIDRRNLPRPLFAVGNTGTLTKMDTNIGNVDFPAVAELRAIAVKHQLIFKEHNADYLDLATLARHPKEGIGMINVAPEFGKLETEALLQLADREEALLGSGAADNSMLRATLLRCIRRSNKWRKWVANPEDAEDIFDDEQSATRIAIVNGHYFFRKEEVREARRKLYDNVQRLKLCDDAQEYVKAHIRSGVLRYINGLGLKDLLHRAKAA